LNRHFPFAGERPGTDAQPQDKPRNDQRDRESTDEWGARLQVDRCPEDLADHNHRHGRDDRADEPDLQIRPDPGTVSRTRNNAPRRQLAKREKQISSLGVFLEGDSHSVQPTHSASYGGQ
jgi:hypothetical protein